MAIRAALNVAGWLPFALVAIIKMHYNPSASPSFPLYPVATGSFPLEGEPLIFSSFRLSFGEPTVPSAIYSLCRGELSTLATDSSSLRLLASSAPPVMLAERMREEESFPPSSSFQFKFASAQERGAFHSQTRPSLSRLDQRRTFRHLINLPTGVHVYLVQ